MENLLNKFKPDSQESHSDDYSRLTATYSGALGLVLLALGIFAIIFPSLFSFAISIVIGLVLTSKGLGSFVLIFSLSGPQKPFKYYLYASFHLAFGLFLLFSPDQGSSVIALVLSAWLIINGSSKIGLSIFLQERTFMLAICMSGVISVILGMLLLFIGNEEWLLALFFGIDLIILGIALIVIYIYLRCGSDYRREML